MFEFAKFDFSQPSGVPDICVGGWFHAAYMCKLQAQKKLIIAEFCNNKSGEIRTICPSNLTIFRKKLKIYVQRERWKSAARIATFFSMFLSAKRNHWAYRRKLNFHFEIKH